LLASLRPPCPGGGGGRRPGLGAGAGGGDVDEVDDEGRLLQLLQRGLERRDQRRRELLDAKGKGRAERAVGENLPTRSHPPVAGMRGGVWPHLLDSASMGGDESMREWWWY